LTEDMTLRTAGFIESAATLLGLSRQMRPSLNRWDHQAFAASVLGELFGECITGEEIADAVDTATRQEGLADDGN